MEDLEGAGGWDGGGAMRKSGHLNWETAQGGKVVGSKLVFFFSSTYGEVFAAMYGKITTSNKQTLH